MSGDYNNKLANFIAFTINYERLNHTPVDNPVLIHADEVIDVLNGIKTGPNVNEIIAIAKEGELYTRLPHRFVQ